MSILYGLTCYLLFLASTARIAGWKAHTIGDNGYLELSNLGSIQMRGKAKIWGTPTTCTIVHRHHKWYASITINCEPGTRELGTGAS